MKEIDPDTLICSIASGYSFTRFSYFNISSTPSNAPVADIILANDSLILELELVNYPAYIINDASSLKLFKYYTLGSIHHDPIPLFHHTIEQLKIQVN